MIPSKFLDGDGLKNLRGHVNAVIVESPPESDNFEIHWTCPYCHDKLYMNAVEYLVNYTIEDGRTGFAHCNGVDYAIFLPKLLPEGFWNKVPHHMRTN